jgi:GNAT superfamily N-acetyltransferase
MPRNDGFGPLDSGIREARAGNISSSTVINPIDVVLRDGATARLRQASMDDRERLHEFYGHLSPQSRYFRFFGKPRVDSIVEDVVHALASRDAVTLVAEVERGIVAVAQYFPTETSRAEAAFAIADAHQGRGIGTKLLERLGVVARSRGITSFEAYLLRDNERMRQVLVDSGFSLTWDRVDGQTRHVVFSLAESTQLYEKERSRARAAAQASLRHSFGRQQSPWSAPDAGGAALARRFFTISLPADFVAESSPSIRPVAALKAFRRSRRSLTSTARSRSQSLPLVAIK